MQHNKINYIEFPAKNMFKTKMFFAKCFAWKFQDYGTDYCAFFESGLDGGFYKSDQKASTAKGSCLVVIYSDSLQQTQQAIEQHGGKITKSIFDFPGGRRFHFTEPSGSEFAVWSDQ
ncbi:MAG: VOC family protein [Enterobacterales bacterium]|nr:VOC family protein [Enterobacterales bacterium]